MPDCLALRRSQHEMNKYIYVCINIYIYIHVYLLFFFFGGGGVEGGRKKTHVSNLCSVVPRFVFDTQMHMLAIFCTSVLNLGNLDVLFGVAWCLEPLCKTNAVFQKGSVHFHDPNLPENRATQTRCWSVQLRLKANPSFSHSGVLACQRLAF